MEIKAQEKPNVELKDILSFTLNSDNLQKYLDFFLNTDNFLKKEVSDTKIRLDRVEEDQKITAEILFRLNVNEKKIDDIYKSMHSFQAKIIDLESKFSKIDELSTKVNDLTRASNETNLRFGYLQENINVINKLTETNIKNIEKTTTSVNSIKDSFTAGEHKIEKISADLKFVQTLTEEKNLTNDLRIASLEKSVLNQAENINSLLDRINKNSNNNNNTNNNTNLGLNQNTFSSNNNLINLESDNNNIFNTNETQNKNTNKENNNALITLNTNNNNSNSDINYNNKGGLLKSPTKSNGQEVTNKELAILKTNFEMQLTNLKNDIKNINKDVISKQKELYNYIASQLSEIENKNSDSVFNKTKKSEIFKMPMFDIKDENKQSNENRLEDDDENNPSLKFLNERLDEIEERLFELEDVNKNKFKTNKNLGSNITNSNNELNSSGVMENSFNNGNGSNKNPQMQKLVRDLSANLLFNDFLSEKINAENKKLERFVEKANNNSDEITRINSDIGKIYESILALRKLFNEKSGSDTGFNSDATKNLYEMQENFYNFSTEYEKRVSDLEKLFRKVKDNIEESTRGLMDKDEFTSGNNLKDAYHFILKKLHNVIDKADKNSIKLDNFSGEVINKLKKDLNADSQKVFEEFKLDLKNMIYRIDEQLRDKVDFNNFDEYGRKLDQKISNDLNKKIDKVELKKNNNIINKKIDHLENKISKTLVETLIDLQLEDTPLIVKKGPGGDKCGSCNQHFQKELPLSNILNSPSHNHRLVTENASSFENPNNKFQLKNIQDYSNRLGFGSYSRMISSNNSEIEELAKINYNSLNVNPNSISISSSHIIANPSSKLPDIQKRGGSNYNNRSSQKDKLSDIIHSELDGKRRIKGEDLLRVVEKFQNENSSATSNNGDFTKK